MTYADRILSHLAKVRMPLCDDCLAEELGIRYRQQARLRSLQLEEQGAVLRDRSRTCERCGGTKICTQWSGAEPVLQAKPGVIDVSRPWYWEGNVQRVIVGWLHGRGWRIESSADTASKQHGIDIIAMREGRRLLVSVKGYPQGTMKTNPSTQARHWFSHAVTDLIRYRTEHPEAELAIGVPDRGVTYRKLHERLEWAFERLPASVFWVTEIGLVEDVDAR